MSLITSSIVLAPNFLGVVSISCIPRLDIGERLMVEDSLDMMRLYGSKGHVLRAKY